MALGRRQNPCPHQPGLAGVHQTMLLAVGFQHRQGDRLLALLPQFSLADTLLCYQSFQTGVFVGEFRQPG